MKGFKNMKTNNSETKVTTGTGRFSYEHLFHRQIFNGQQGKYGLSFLIPKDDEETIRKIKAAIRAAYEAGKSKLKSGDKVLPLESIDLPLHDGDVEKAGDPNYAGHYFLNAKCSDQPLVVDRQKERITEPSAVWSGDYGRISVNFYAYNYGRPGIAAWLNGVQLLKKGPKIGGHGSALNDFDAVDEDDEEDELPF